VHDARHLVTAPRRRHLLLRGRRWRHRARDERLDDLRRARSQRRVLGGRRLLRVRVAAGGRGHREREALAPPLDTHDAAERSRRLFFAWRLRQVDLDGAIGDTACRVHHDAHARRAPIGATDHLRDLSGRQAHHGTHGHEAERRDEHSQHGAVGPIA
jgi:hypothetical protein